MSGTLILRPNAVYKTAGGAWSIGGGAGSQFAAVNDNSDTTYITDTPGGGYNEIHFACDTSSLPANAVVKRVYPVIRCNQTSGAVKMTTWAYAVGIGLKQYYQTPFNTWITGASITTSQAAAGPGWSGGYAWPQYRSPQNLVDDIIVAIKNVNSVASFHRIYELYVYVEYDEAPTITSMAFNPSDAVTRTLQPQLTWVYADVENSPQNQWSLAVWANADTLDANFPASAPFVRTFTKAGGGTATAAYLTSGTGTASNTTLNDAAAGALANNTAYKAYMAAADFINGAARYGPASSAFSFTTGITPPPVPVAPTVTDQASNFRIKIDLAGSLNMLSALDANPEASIGSWGNDQNATVAADTTTAAAIGTGSVKITSTTTGTIRGKTNANYPVTVGRVYSAVASLRSAVTARSARIGIRWEDSAGNSVGYTYGSLSTTTVGSYVVYTTGGLTAPAGAVFAEVVAEFQGAAAAGEQMNVDKIQLAPGNVSTWTPAGQVPVQVEVQRSWDNVYWNLIPASVPADTMDTGQLLTVYDTVYRNGAQPYYRWRTLWYDASTSANVYSDWSAGTRVGVVGTVKTFVLRDPDDETLFAVPAKVSMGDLVADSEELEGLYTPLGFNAVVAVSQSISGKVYRYQYTFTDGFNSATFDNLRSKRKVVLLLDDVGNAIWVKIGPHVTERIINNPGRKSAFTITRQYDFELWDAVAPPGLVQWNF